MTSCPGAFSVLNKCTSFPQLNVTTIYCPQRKVSPHLVYKKRHFDSMDDNFRRDNFFVDKLQCYWLLIILPLKILYLFFYAFQLFNAYTTHSHGITKLCRHIF